MKQVKYLTNVAEFFSSSRFLTALAFLLFTLLMTVILASQNFFFQSIIENGISKKDIIAKKTITVVDVQRTEQHRREIAQKVDPILVPAEDDFIKNNLAALQSSIMQIRKKNTSFENKKDETSILFDIPDGSRKEYVLNYLLKTSDNNLQQIFDKSSLTLSNILAVGITEKDYDGYNLGKFIRKNAVSNVSRNQLGIITAMLEQVIMPNLVVDENATEIAKKNAQNSVKPYDVVFKKGDKIVFEGEPVTRLKRDALRKAGYNVIEMDYKGLLGIFVIVVLGTLAFLKYMKSFEKHYLDSSHLLVVAVLSLLFVAIASLIPTGFSPYVLPMPAFILLLAIFANPRIALIAASILLAVLSISFAYNVQFVIAFIIINLISTIAISKVKFTRRFDLVKTGIEIAVAAAITLLSIYLLEKCLADIDNYVIITDTCWLFVNCILSGVIALGTLPLLESAFRIITPYGLAELADHNQSLLKRLQMDAPGTYHHSLMVSNLCEAAAEAVGANPILARVGALYHDIGKLKRPLFFVENQSYFGIENPHTKLNPRFSKMVITAHPKDGVELAKESGLPPVIYNFILQHHGEGLASYFYTQAVQEEGIENVKKEQFRYTGPKPNMKETAILMIADAVESAVRAMKGASSEEIEKIIDKIIIERLNDGQLSDSPLTLKDLRTIAATFNRILRGMQHNRIKYHEDIIQEFGKAKIDLPKTLMDKELTEKIKKLETPESQNPPSHDETNENKKENDSKDDKD